jgi:hypothetical protein
MTLISVFFFTLWQLTGLEALGPFSMKDGNGMLAISGIATFFSYLYLWLVLSDGKNPFFR